MQKRGVIEVLEDDLRKIYFELRELEDQRDKEWVDSMTPEEIYNL